MGAIEVRVVELSVWIAGFVELGIAVGVCGCCCIGWRTCCCDDDVGLGWLIGVGGNVDDVVWAGVNFAGK